MIIVCITKQPKKKERKKGIISLYSGYFSQDLGYPIFNLLLAILNEGKALFISSCLSLSVHFAPGFIETIPPFYQEQIFSQ